MFILGAYFGEGRAVKSIKYTDTVRVVYNPTTTSFYKVTMRILQSYIKSTIHHTLFTVLKKVN
jgi:hypothetical protein